MSGEKSPGSSASKKAEEAGEKPTMKNFWRILSYGSHLDRFLMGLAALSAGGSGVALPLMNIVFGSLVGHFNDYFIPDSGVTKAEFMDSINKNVLYIVYLFIGKFVLGYISMFCLRMTSIRISANLRLAYLRALFNQPIEFMDKLPIGRPTETITSSSNLIQAGISDKLAILIQSLALVVAAYAVAFSYSWSLALVASAPLLLILIIYSAIIPLYLKLYKKIEDANEKASSIAGEAFGSIRTIIACGAESRFAIRHAEHMDEAKKRGLQTSPLVGVQLGPVHFAMYCNFALTFWFGIRQYRDGNISGAGPVAIVIFSMFIVVSSVSFIASPIIAITKAVSASTNFFSVLDARPLKTSGLKDIDVSSFDDIKFNQVNFSYPNRPNVNVLNDICLSFPMGKVTALVGQSGCGKSTIVALLERWYQLSNQLEGKDIVSFEEKDSKRQEDPSGDNISEPNRGSITIGPYNIDELDLKWWRSQIGLVQQEPFLFNTSIFSNVSFGLIGSKWENETEEVKRELVKEACQEAFADEFIDRLPDGYNTLIGENGIKLSGGQRQRLAIARSIIKRPPILILDEATSSIDVRGERIVQDALDRVSKNRTTITIAHRLSTIKKADNIVVMQKGAAVEQGTHDELLSQQGIYSSLVGNQQLEMGGENIDLTVERARKSSDVILSQTKSASTFQEQDSDHPDVITGEAYKPRSLINSVGVFIWEQRKYWVMYLAIVMGAAGCGSGYSLQGYLFANLISVFQLTGNRLTERGNFWSLMFFILAIAIAIFYFILGWASVSVSTRISTTYRQKYFECIVEKPIPFFDRDINSAGSLTGRLSTDPTQLQELLGPTMAFPLISVFNVIGCIAVSFAFGWKLTLVTIFSAFPIIIVAMFVRIRYEVTFEKMNTAVFAESSQFASEAIGAFRTVTSLTLEDTITTRYSDLLKDHVRSAFLKARHGTLVFAASDSLELPCMALCFWYGGKLLSTYEYNVVQFFVIYIAVVLGGQAAGQFGSVSPNIAQATAAANRILSVRPVVETNTGREKLNNFNGGTRIEFDSVKFKYPSRDAWVFKDLSFTIKKGQFAALVGPSGCGKTSVIGLLERFYNYQSGRIRIDGIELNTLDLHWYRKCLSLVSQEPTLYQGSIQDNILLGVDPKSVNQDAVNQACRDAEIHDFIQSLPEGYDTDVGSRGLSLSGGQKQRICIARALIRKPQLLLLDEATSSLDSESEKQVQAAIERTAKDRTVVVVAHRLATVQNADIIFVFGEGGIVESGTHHSLLKERGVYHQMCESQALDR